MPPVVHPRSSAPFARSFIDPRVALPEPVVPNPLRGPSPGAMSPQSRQMLTALTAALGPNRSSPIVSADAR